MAVLAAILPLVSQSSALALVLYRLAAADVHVYAAKYLLRTAKAVSNLALIVKEIGTIIKEDDRLPSAEAFETIDDVLDQSTAILTEIDSTVSGQNAEQARRRQGEQREGEHGVSFSPQSVARLHYLEAHLDSLRAILSVMLQSLYTAQSIMWARVRPTVSPRQCATAVVNEKQQLETLIIDQQMTILLASKLYEQAGPDARLLMEYDSALSLSVIDDAAPKPAGLAKYLDQCISSLDTQTSEEEHWLAPVCAISKARVERLLDRWTRLRQFEQQLLDAERKVQAQKRETQQPFVESDSEEDIESVPKFCGSGFGPRTPVPRKSGTIPPLFAESHTLPVPIHHPAEPTSAPASPRASCSTLPVEAAAAVEAKDKDDDVDLEIPWTLRTRRYYWNYIDGKVQNSNSDMPSSEAFAHRHSWTEVQASWVCKEALKEAAYPFTQVQKEIADGRRTKFETWFCIDQPLTFDQVQRLVERTVELYRKTQPPSPPPARERTRRTSFERRAPPKDRDRTPVPTQAKPPPLERSATVYHISQPPPLDRTMSMPGPGQAPLPPLSPTYPPNPRPSNLQVPPPTPAPNLPQSPSCPPKPSIIIPPYPNHRTFAQPAPYHPPPPPARHPQPPVYPQSPLRTSLDGARYEHYSSTSGASDSEGVTRSRKQRERSRRRGSDGRGKKHGKTKAMIGVAGLTALLDGLVGI